MYFFTNRNVLVRQCLLKDSSLAKFVKATNVLNILYHFFLFTFAISVSSNILQLVNHFFFVYYSFNFLKIIFMAFLEIFFLHFAKCFCDQSKIFLQLFCSFQCCHPITKFSILYLLKVCLVTRRILSIYLKLEKYQFYYYTCIQVVSLDSPLYEQLYCCINLN